MGSGKPAEYQIEYMEIWQEANVCWRLNCVYSKLYIEALTLTAKLTFEEVTRGEWSGKHGAWQD